MDMFQRIRANRIAALQLAKQRRATEFSPFRCRPITEIAWTPTSNDRGELQLTLDDATRVVLPHFYQSHALRLQALPVPDRIEYLREIWLNYNAWRLRDG